MSFAYEDWKRFDLISGQLKISDAAGGDDVICNAQPGGWVALCEYDDSNKIRYVVSMRDFMANGISDGRVRAPNGSTYEHREFDSKSGLVFFVDRRMDNKLPENFDVPEHRLNPDIVDKYGKPSDDGKSELDKFIECLFHLGRDYRSKMPTLESIGFGAVCDMGIGSMDCELLYNDKRDVIGFEIHNKSQDE